MSYQDEINELMQHSSSMSADELSFFMEATERVLNETASRCDYMQLDVLYSIHVQGYNEND